MSKQADELKTQAYSFALEAIARANGFNSWNEASAAPLRKSGEATPKDYEVYRGIAANYHKAAEGSAVPGGVRLTLDVVYPAETDLEAASLELDRSMHSAIGLGLFGDAPVESWDIQLSVGDVPKRVDLGAKGFGQVRLQHAVGISEDDVFEVLRRNANRISNISGVSLAVRAEVVFNNLDENDLDRVATAALNGGSDMDLQTNAAHEELTRGLEGLGVREAATLQPFVVTYRDEDQDARSEPLRFECLADDTEHAREQAENAYPGCAVIQVQRANPARA